MASRWLGAGRTKPFFDVARAIHGRVGFVKSLILRGKAKFLAGISLMAAGGVKLQNEAIYEFTMCDLRFTRFGITSGRWRTRMENRGWQAVIRSTVQVANIQHSTPTSNQCGRGRDHRSGGAGRSGMTAGASRAGESEVRAGLAFKNSRPNGHGVSSNGPAGLEAGTYFLTSHDLWFINFVKEGLMLNRTKVGRNSFRFPLAFWGLRGKNDCSIYIWKQRRRRRQRKIHPQKC